MEICFLACAYRTPSGYCGSTGGSATCPHRQKKQTNADRIRSMTDEELARLFANTEANFPPNFPNGVSVKLCTTAWLDWLKREAQCTSE